MNRRRFLGQAALSPLGIVGGRVSFGRKSGSSSQRSANIKISCNLYSFNSLLRENQMTLEEVIDFCAELGFDAVDPTGYYFPGYPQAPEPAYIHQIKRRAFLQGMDISGTGMRNDFTHPDKHFRDLELAFVERWVDVAAMLHAPVLRVFAGHPDASLFESHTRDEVKNWVVEGLRQSAKYGAEKGVMIVLQNHNAVLKTATEVLEIYERVNSDWFGLNVDIGSLRTGNPYEEIARLAPYACTWQIKENVYRNEIEEKTDIGEIVRILNDAGYRGYIPLEVLRPGDPREELPALLDEVRQALA